MSLEPAGAKATITGLVLEIQRMSTEDGPGVRTTVFLKGCPLRCIWCHNPESVSPKPQVIWIESRCIGCRTCLEVCPDRALSHGPEGVRIDLEICQGCGLCAEACPSTALELLGRQWEVEDLADELAKDKAYFDQSGGGITVSGGEAFLQPEFTAALLEACRGRGLATAIDTCGLTSSNNLEMILPYLDLVLFDLKEIDPIRHKELTGSSNEMIFSNLISLRDWMKAHERPRELWIRTPIIPGATAAKENLLGLGRFLAQNLTGAVSRWELCAFNNLCRDKYLRLGLDWPFKDCGLLTRTEMEHWYDMAKTSGVDPKIVHWSGPVKYEPEGEEMNQENHRLSLTGTCEQTG